MPTLLRACRALRRWQPDVVVFQWWSGTVLHNYLILASVARAAGAIVIVEFHESLDTAEDRIPVVRRYVSAMAQRFLRLADGYVVHGVGDRQTIARRFGLSQLPSVVAPTRRSTVTVPHHRPMPRTSRDPFTLLYFGVLRPYKGIDVLLRAFDGLDDETAAGFRLLVVGETWEGWNQPSELIAQNRHSDRIEFVNRYVTDDEVRASFARADAVVLPYRRASASGPLSIAMGLGLPVAISDVGGVRDAIEGYEGAVTFQPDDVHGLQQALTRLRALRGRRFPSPRSWAVTVERLGQLIGAIEGASGGNAAMPGTAARRGRTSRRGAP